MTTSAERGQTAPRARRGSGYSDVLNTLVSSSPAWIRGIVLLLLGGALTGIVITVCIAILAGREVTVWPPHIAEYVPPQVSNCKALIGALPKLRNAEERELERVGIEINNFLAQLGKLRLDYTAKEANVIYIDRVITDIKKDIEPFHKRLDDALSKMQKRSDDVVNGCLVH
jgi:hypothetical protein